MKRTLSLVLALVMVLGSFTGVFAAETKAEKVNAPEFLKKVGVLEGNDNGDLMLDKNLKRRDTVVLLSRLMGVEDVAKNFPAADDVLTFKDITDASYKGYLAWSVSNKLIEGHTPERFGFNEFITAQQYAAILLRALGYEIDDAAYEKCLETSKGLGILANVEVENKTEITRAQMAEMTFNALGAKMKDKDQTLADKLSIKLPTPEKLEVEKVVADNLKEIKVVFNKAVDRDNAEDKDNYSTNVGAIKDAKVVDGNTVILTLADNIEMKNKKEYKLNIRGIKDGGSAVNTEFKFTALDNAIPEVVEVVGLGTKAVKVVMSEPVKDVKSSNFAVDGKTYYGSVSVTGREIILKPYGSSFSIGEHTLVVKSLEDYAGFKSVEREIKFDIAEDKEAPTVVEVKGTLERVVVTFSEDVDDATVSRDSLYWGGTKTNKAEKVVRLSGNRYAFEFSTEKALPTYEVTLTISGVKDYSANEMKSTDVPFKAEIDTTRPEVVEVKVKEGNVIEVRFNKAVKEDDVKKRENFSLVDEDGKKVSIKTPEVDPKDSRVVKIGLYSELKENKDYTLKISGLRDNTKLQNTMLPYEEKITAGNYKNPTAETTVIPSVEKGIVRLQVTFNKKMDVEMISQESNYFVAIDGKEYSLSVIEGTVDVVQDGKAAILVLPEKIKLSGSTSEVTVESLFNKGKVEYVKVLAVKDTAGNVLSNYGVKLDVKEGTLEIKEAVATDSRTIEVEFNQTITNAERSNFDVKGLTIDRVVTKGNKKVVIELTDRDGNKLNADLKGDEVRVSGKLETVLGKLEVEQDKDGNGEKTGSKLLTVDNKLLVDEISPSLKKAEASISKDKKELRLTLIFDENLDAAFQTVAASDFIIKRTDGKNLDTNKMKSVIEKDSNKLVLIITQMFDKEEVYATDKTYEIDTKEKPNAVRDIAGNSMNALERAIIVESFGSHDSDSDVEKDNLKAAKAAVAGLFKDAEKTVLADEVTIKDIEAAEKLAEKVTNTEEKATLVTAIKKAKALLAEKNEAAALKAIKDAKNEKDMLAALKDAGIKLAKFDELSMADQAKVLAALIGGTYEDLAAVQTKLDTEVQKIVETPAPVVKHTITFELTPTDSEVEVKKDGVVVSAKTAGTYELEAGAYTYTVTKDGYKTKADVEFNVTETETITVTLEKAE